MIKRLNSWFIANLGWLTVSGLIAIVVVCLLFIPTATEKMQHASRIATHNYMITQTVLRLLFAIIALYISITTVIFTYKNYDAVIAQRLFKSKGKVISASPAGYTFNRFLMASVLTVLISATILVFI
jgi:hypothetical protein